MWLLDKCVSDAGPFLGVKPPTAKEVYLKFKKIKGNKPGNNPSIREAARKTSIEVISWWKKTNIELKSERMIIKMIEKIDSAYKTLYFQRNKVTSEQKTRRKEFLTSVSKTFWAVSPSYEASLLNSTDPRSIEDLNFLKNMKTTRSGGLGSLDVKYQKRLKRKKLDEKMEETRIKKNARRTEEAINQEEIGTDEVLCEGSQDSDYIPNTTRIRHKQRIDVLSPGLCAISDKYSNSNRGLMQIVGETLKMTGLEMSDVSLSVSTVKRRRNSYRTTLGEKYRKLNEENIAGTCIHTTL